MHNIQPLVITIWKCVRVSVLLTCSVLGNEIRCSVDLEVAVVIDCTYKMDDESLRFRFSRRTSYLASDLWAEQWNQSQEQMIFRVRHGRKHHRHHIRRDTSYQRVSNRPTGGKHLTYLQ